MVYVRIVVSLFSTTLGEIVSLVDLRWYARLPVIYSIIRKYNTSRGNSR